MAKKQVHEIIISKKDHHLLTADAEVYSLAFRDALVAFEDYLAGADRDLFLQHLNTQNSEWFTVCFLSEPDYHYFIRILPAEKEYENIRIVLSRADKMIDSYQDMIFTLGSHHAMLGLFEDLFFEYRPEDDTITFYNTEHSHFDEGVHSFEEFAKGLRRIITEDNVMALETLIRHLRTKTPSFMVTFSQNIFNEDSAITDTMFRGAVAHHEGLGESVVGLVHPLRQRGSGNNSNLNYDPLTGLVNKEDITQLSTDRIDNRCIANTTIAIVDVDYFKNVNDSHGHQFGDIVLKEVARIMKTEIGDDGICGRIGGDEFIILFGSSVDRETLRAHLRNIKTLVKAAFPNKGPRGEMPITLSMGSATYPGDATNYNDLFMVADYCLYLAKEKGRNRYVLYTHEKHLTLEQIRNSKTDGENLVNGRDDLPLGDVMVQMLFMIRYGKRPLLSSLLPEFAERFKIPLILLGVEDPVRPILMTGKQEDECSAVVKELELLLHPDFRKTHLYKHDMVICNDITHLPAELRPMAMERLERADIRSFVICPFTDVKGRKAFLLFASLHQNLVWNEQHYMHYRLFMDAMALYDLEPYMV